MDLRSHQTIERKRAEASAERNVAHRKRAEAQRARAEAQRRQREEESMDIKAEKAQKHSEELRRDREEAVRRIAGYHRHIDNCTAEMREHERKIDECRERIKRQQNMISQRRAEAATNRLDADLLRTEADMACLQGSSDRQLHGNHKSAKHQSLMQEAEAKQREAMAKDSEAADLERQAVETERNVHRLCDSLIYNGRQRGMIERDRDIEERRRDEMAEKLSVYKREVANCETTARLMRDEEARLEAIYNSLEEQADRADRVADIAEEEAKMLEKELVEKEAADAAMATEEEARDREERRRQGGSGSWM